MRGGFSFGSYYPGNSPLHRLDPRTKLLGAMAFIVMALFAANAAAIAVLALFAIALYLIGGIPARKALRSLAPLLLIVVLASVMNLFVVQGGEVLMQIGPLRISEAGVERCALVGFRVLLMMAVMSLVTLTTMTLDLTEAFERLLSPLARLGFPAHELGMILGLALRFMPQFANELAVIRNAQMSRGAALTTSPVKGTRALSSLMIPLFTSVFRHAETLSDAMEARCYHGREGRTRLHPLKLHAQDAVAACCLAGLAACVFAANLLL